MKKKIITISCIVISFISALANNQNIFLSDSKSLIEILLTLLGLSFTSFSFISSSIKNIINNSKKNVKNLEPFLNKLEKSIKEDIFLIFYSTIVLILINIITYIDIPLITNPINICFNLFTISSVKMFIINFFVSFITCLSIYSFYDLMKASFNLLQKNQHNS